MGAMETGNRSSALLFRTLSLLLVSASILVSARSPVRHDFSDDEDYLFGSSGDGSGEGSGEGSGTSPIPRDSRLSIDYSIPSTARGILGQRVELPCRIRGQTTSTNVKWTRVKDSEVLVVSNTVIVGTQRFSGNYLPSSSVFYLVINNLEESDAGEYECFVMESWPKLKAKVTLQVVEPSEDLLWNSESKCGTGWWDLGSATECDPEGVFPCCSGTGWCGFTKAHCDCGNCVDYRDYERPVTAAATTQPPPTTTTEGPAVRWRDDYKCEGSHRVQVGPHEGEVAICNPNGTNYCCSDWGWCGASSAYCDCSGCTNYKEEYGIDNCEGKYLCNDYTTCIPMDKKCDHVSDCEGEEDENECCYPPYQEIGSRCVLFSSHEERGYTWSEASQHCEDKGAKLITFYSLDHLISFVKTLINATESVFKDEGATAPHYWVSLSTEGRYEDGDRHPDLFWRWTESRSSGDQGIPAEKGGSSMTIGDCHYLDHSPQAVVRGTSDCRALKLPLCEVYFS